MGFGRLRRRSWSVALSRHVHSCSRRATRPVGNDHDRLMTQLGALPYAALDAEAEECAQRAQSELARCGHHRIPPVDLLVAAIAHTQRDGVLHCDRHYEPHRRQDVPRIHERVAGRFAVNALICRTAPVHPVARFGCGARVTVTLAAELALFQCSASAIVDDKSCHGGAQ